MARGGIYDQLGGGFHRYSTDAHWLVPHFEKMLYDNAQLARTYLHAWQITGDAAFGSVVEETLDYVLREMTSPEGGFYSTQDADSEGEEGKFYSGRRTSAGAAGGGGRPAVQRLLRRHRARQFPRRRPSANILHAGTTWRTPPRARCPRNGLPRSSHAAAACSSTARERRVHPGRDEKILAEWNGLMMHAFAEAGAVLGRADYIEPR